MSELNITASQIQGEVPVTVLHLSGHLHGTTEVELLDRARQAKEDGSQHLLLDLSGVEVLTSAGLRAIHNIFNLFTPQSDLALIKQHGEEPYKSPYFKLASPNPNVYYILNIAGFLQNILIYNNLEEAANSFSE
jgi:anti-anti-sigma regulatory factor